MDEEEKALAAKLKERERKEHVRIYANSVVNEAEELLGPKAAPHIDLFIECVNQTIEKWLKGMYKQDFQGAAAIESAFYKKLSSEEGYTVYLYSPIGQSYLHDYEAEFPSRIVEKLGRQHFAQKIGAKKEYEQYTHELAPYLEELKKSQAKKETTEWKRIEKMAGVSSRVPADIKEHIEVIMSYLLKRGEINKRQAEGLKEWEKVDDKVGARRRKFLEPHLL